MSLLNATIMQVSSLAIGLLSYFVIFDLITSLPADIASYFVALCGMFTLWGNNLTLFVICYALAFGTYMRWHL